MLDVLPRIAYSPRESAKILGVSVPKMYDLLNSGEIKSRKTGTRRLIPFTELERFMGEVA